MAATIRRFKLLRSSCHENGRTYERGDIVPSPHDLVALFGKEKFEELHTAPVPNQTTDPAVIAAVALGTAEVAAPTPVIATLGDEVTADFPSADESDLRIFKRGKAYFITRATTPNDALNEEPIGSKVAVNEFVANLAKA
jgi:hypothetical protein